MIYIAAPPNKTQKIIRRLHPLASCPLHLLPRRCLTSHPLCLFVVVASSLCPLSSFPISSRRHATLLRCVASLIVPLVSLLLRRRVLGSLRPRVLASSRCRVLSCLVVVSRPLTHLVMPALFDCCIVALHIVITARSVLLSLSYCCHRRVVA